jgi:hypothetical protein
LAAARVCRNYGAVTAACMLTPGDCSWNWVADERTWSHSTTWLLYRLADKGYRCVCAAEAELYHEGKTRGTGSRVDEIALSATAAGEPYYNPNLSTTTFRGAARRFRAECHAGQSIDGVARWMTGAPLQFEMAQALRIKGQLDPIVISRGRAAAQPVRSAAFRCVSAPRHRRVTSSPTTSASSAFRQARSG